MCVCIYMCTSIHRECFKASFVWMRWDTREHINNVLLKTLNYHADSIHSYFRMLNVTFQLAALSCLHTRSRQSHGLMHMGPFSTWGLQSPFSRRPLRYALHLDKVSFIDELVLTCLFLCVYVCILCVCVCILFHCNSFFRLQLYLGHS